MNNSDSLRIVFSLIEARILLIDRVVSKECSLLKQISRGTAAAAPREGEISAGSSSKKKELALF